DLPGAIAAYRQAIACDSKRALVHHNLGCALQATGQTDEAISCFRQALTLDPELAHAHIGLGQGLLQRGHFVEAQAAIQRGLGLLSPQDPHYQQATRHLERCERMLALEPKLPALLKGEAQPKDAEEHVAVAELCQLPGKRLYVASVRSYDTAFAL